MHSLAEFVVPDNSDAIGICIVIPAFNAGRFLEETLLAAAQQRIPEGYALEIAVVDDGSTDDTADLVSQLSLPCPLRLVSGGSNRGRAGACNLGIRNAVARYVLILDADCVLVGSENLVRAIARVEAGFDIVIGAVTGQGRDFWARLNESLLEQRMASSDILQMTSAVLFARRNLMDQAGGFHEGYTRYGFEDRDLFASLLQLRPRKICIEPGLLAKHEDRPALGTICRKMIESGRHSSQVFRRRHPEVYASLSYAKADRSAYSPLIGYLVEKACSGMLAFTPLWSRLLRQEYLPFSLRRKLLFIYQGAAFFIGTSLRDEDAR
jgi:glycosyltransferase involved in cell wall biosynthesis